MGSSTIRPQSVAIENVVFVEFRVPTKQCYGWRSYRESRVDEMCDSICRNREIMLRARDLARRARELSKPGGVQVTEDEALAAALLLGPDSADSFPAQHRA